MSASPKTKILLAFRSGKQCAFPNCGKTLTVEGDKADLMILGEAAHIAGEKKEAARFDMRMTDAQRDHYNRNFLCYVAVSFS